MKIFKNLGYLDIQFFSDIHPKEERLDFMRWIMNALQEMTLKEMAALEKPRRDRKKDKQQKKVKANPKIKFLCFIKSGEVQYFGKHSDDPYHSWKEGDLFGFEDFIYRMDDAPRNCLVDDLMHFSHVKIDVWKKRKFKLSSIQNPYAKDE